MPCGRKRRVVSLLLKSDGLADACPRCGAESSVELYSLSATARTLVVVAQISIVAGAYWDRQNLQVYILANSILTLLVVFGGNRAKCRSCGKSLTRELGVGWR